MHKKNLKTLSELLIEYKQYCSNTADIYTLNYYNEDILQELEVEKNNNSDVNSYYVQIKKGFEKHHFDSAQHIELFNLYSEAEIFLLLKKRIKNITKIPERSDSTPDFECEIQTNENPTKNLKFYIELKTFGLHQSEHHMNDIQNNSLEDNIGIEEKIHDLRSKKQTGIIFNEREISPLRKKSHDQPISTAITSLIDKMNQNYKSGQYDSGLTIPLYNLVLLCLPIGKEDLSPVLMDCKKYSFRNFMELSIWRN